MAWHQDTGYRGFGPADPSAGNLLMGGADVVLLGYDDDGVPYAVDYYLSTYEVCNYGSECK